MSTPMEQVDLAGEERGLDGWDLAEGKLRRSFDFGDFSEAFAFMTRVALVAEQIGHHPDWRNHWSRVDISLQTEDARGVTELDLEMARLINAIAP